MKAAKDLQAGDNMQVRYEKRWSNHYIVTNVNDVSFYFKRPMLQVECITKSFLMTPDEIVKVNA